MLSSPSPAKRQTQEPPKNKPALHKLLRVTGTSCKDLWDSTLNLKLADPEHRSLAVLSSEDVVAGCIVAVIRAELRAPLGNLPVRLCSTTCKALALLRRVHPV